MMMHELVKDLKRHVLEKAAFSKRALFLHTKEPAAPAPAYTAAPKPKQALTTPLKKAEPITSNVLRPEAPQKKQPPIPAPTISLQFKEIVEKHSNLTIVEKIPSDAVAKRRARLWMHGDFSKEVIVIRYGKDPQDNAFLDNLWKAIDERLKPAEIVDGEALEGQKLWDQLLGARQVRWILCCHAALLELPTLHGLYREDADSKQRFIGHIPLLLLPSVQTFATNPAKKRELWNRLCQVMNPSGSPASSSTAL